MQIILNIVFIFIAALLQISVLPHLAIFRAYPNLILIVMLSLIFIQKKDLAIWWALVGGLALDLTSSGFFGLYTATLLIIFWLFSFITKRVFAHPPLYIAAILFFTASLLLDLPWVIQYKEWTILFSQAIYNTVVGCIAYYFIGYYAKPKEAIKI